MGRRGLVPVLLAAVAFGGCGTGMDAIDHALQDDDPLEAPRIEPTG